MRILMRLGIPGQSAGESVDNLLVGGRFEEIFISSGSCFQIEEPRFAAGGVDQFIAVGHRAEPAFGTFGRAQDRNVLPFVIPHLSEKAIGISAINL